MKNYFYQLVLLVSLFTLSTPSKAQTVGSFDTTINFMAANRTISLHVPTTYTPTNAYKLMVCLHGLGDNSTNYRNALMSSFSWNGHFPNTIFVCPETANINADFYSPTGNEQIILESINLAIAKYNIDTNSIILQGFSLGGRAALRYGLNNYQLFKGLLLNTPAIQGSKNAINDIPTYTFNYSNGNKLPIYITHGMTDELYTSPIDSTVEQLILNDAMVRYNDIAGVGHSIPNFSLMNDVTNFLNNPSSVNYDADLVKLMVQERTCQNQTNATCLVRNVGIDTIQSLTLEYSINGIPQTMVWTGNLIPFQHAIIALPTLTLSNGQNSIDGKIQFINTTIADTILLNNQKSNTVNYVNIANSLPDFQGFEGTTFPPSDYLFERLGDDYTYFDLDDVVFKSGLKSIYAFNTILLFDNAGRKAEIHSPILNLSASTTPNMSFDMAYNFQRYTPPYFTANTDFTDTLEILISTDCGTSFQSLYKKWGAQLATFANPILNPLNVQSCFINPADSNWKKVVIDLSSYASATEAVVKLSYISGLGGNINIDNILFSKSPLGLDEVIAPTYKLFPNPANNKVSVIESTDKINKLEVLSLNGYSVLNPSEIMKLNKKEWQLNTSSLPDGIYLLKIYGDHFTRTEKLQISHE